MRTFIRGDRLTRKYPCQHLPQSTLTGYNARHTPGSPTDPEAGPVTDQCRANASGVGPALIRYWDPVSCLAGWFCVGGPLWLIGRATPNWGMMKEYTSVWLSVLPGYWPDWLYHELYDWVEFIWCDSIQNGRFVRLTPRHLVLPPFTWNWKSIADTRWVVFVICVRMSVNHIYFFLIMYINYYTYLKKRTCNSCYIEFNHFAHDENEYSPIYVSVMLLNYHCYVIFYKILSKRQQKSSTAMGN